MGSRIIFITGAMSLIIQILTGIFDFYVLTLKVSENMNILRNLLILEFIVQVIEGSFYIWMVLISQKSQILHHYDIMTGLLLHQQCYLHYVFICCI